MPPQDLRRCWIVFPIKQDSKFADGWNVLYPAGGKLTQIKRVGDLGILQYGNATENWSTDAMGGWMAYMKGQLAYTKHWSTRIVGVTYPDGGCDAAFFTLAGGSRKVIVGRGIPTWMICSEKPVTPTASVTVRRTR